METDTTASQKRSFDRLDSYARIAQEHQAWRGIGPVARRTHLVEASAPTRPGDRVEPDKAPARHVNTTS